MTKHPILIALLTFVLLLGAALCVRFFVLNQKDTATTSAMSTLTEITDITEFSSAVFKYTGIAPVYKGGKEYCKVCYNATIKATIDMNKVQEEYDQENKTITITPPEFEYKVTIIDEKSMSLLPRDAEASIDSLLKYSREDAEKEVKQTDEFITTARDSFESFIKGLLYPIIKAEGYTVVFIWD